MFYPCSDFRQQRIKFIARTICSGANAHHFLIDPNGVIYEGRAGGENVMGSHFSCANSGTIGIAMLGNFMNESPSPKALKSLQSLLARECYKLGLKPEAINYHASTRLKLPVIAGHRDANDAKVMSVCAGTKCPGDKLYALLPDIDRKSVV